MFELLLGFRCKKKNYFTTTRIRNNKRNPTFDLYGLGKRL